MSSGEFEARPNIFRIVHQTFRDRRQISHLTLSEFNHIN